MVSSDRRVLLYSHDGCGLGHLRRQLTIAAAVVQQSPGTAVLVATGVDDVGPFAVPPAVDVLKLPGLRKVANDEYVARHLALRPDDTAELRAGLLEAAVCHFRPSVLVADKHPLGPGSELLPALEQLRANGGRAVLGARDVLDDPAVVAAEWQAEHLIEAFERYYDGALLYGTPDLLDPVGEAGIPLPVLRRGSWCGHVLAPPAPDAAPPVDLARDGRPVVMACAGGGEDGGRLLRAFIDASRSVPWKAVVVTGPLAPAGDRHAVETAATEAGVDLHREVSDLRSWFPHVDALVSMGGYNTLVEAAAAACPVVCVPRRQPRREQLIRARAFARRGLLGLVDPDDLSPATLAGAVRAALTVPRAELAARVQGALDLGGAGRAAELLLASGERPVAATAVAT
jgi:predicted glycosyltransferase